jgi:hypothetical protein
LIDRLRAYLATPPSVTPVSTGPEMVKPHGVDVFVRTRLYSFTAAPEVP